MNGRNRLVQPEQKSIWLMEGIVRKVFNPGHMFLDSFAKLLSIAKDY